MSSTESATTSKTIRRNCTFVHSFTNFQSFVVQKAEPEVEWEIRKSAVSEFCLVENIKIQIVIQTSYLRVRRVFKSFQNRSLPDSRFCRRCDN